MGFLETEDHLPCRFCFRTWGLADSHTMDKYSTWGRMPSYVVASGTTRVSYQSMGGRLRCAHLVLFGYRLVCSSESDWTPPSVQDWGRCLSREMVYINEIYYPRGILHLFFMSI